MKTEQQHEEQRIEGAIDTALLNADLLREQVAELEQALLAETQAKHEAVEVLREVLMGKPKGRAEGHSHQIPRSPCQGPTMEGVEGVMSRHPGTKGPRVRGGMRRNP